MLSNIPCSKHCNFFNEAKSKHIPLLSTNRKEEEGEERPDFRVPSLYLIMSSLVDSALLNHPKILNLKDLNSEGGQKHIVVTSSSPQACSSLGVHRSGISCCFCVVADKFNPISVFSALFLHLDELMPRFHSNLIKLTRTGIARWCLPLLCTYCCPHVLSAPF